MCVPCQAGSRIASGYKEDGISTGYDPAVNQLWPACNMAVFRL